MLALRMAAFGLIGSLVIAGAAAQTPDAGADAYPNRPVRIVVPFPAGGPTDILARVVAQRLSEVWSQPVVIENQPGANTAIAAARVAKMPADGYTLLAAMDVTMVLNPITSKNLSYEPLKDFSLISLAAKNTSLLTVRAADGPASVAGADRARQGQSGQAELRRRHHHDAACRLSVQPRGRHQRPVHPVQRQFPDRTGPADRRGRLHRRWHRLPRLADQVRESCARSPSSTAARSPLCRMSNRSRSKPTIRRSTTFRPGSALSHRRARRTRSVKRFSARSRPCTKTRRSPKSSRPPASVP